jgi:subtilisin family serine protease
VDFEHEDLDDVMWVNPGEIPGNQKDDDQNGYVDDVHGWNFLGGPDGKSIRYENLELTRLYAEYKPEFEGKDREDIPKRDRERYDQWKKWGKLINKKMESVKDNYADYEVLKQGLERIKEEIPAPVTQSKLEGFQSEIDILNRVADLFVGIMKEYETDFEGLEANINYWFDHFAQEKAYYDVDLDVRSIVGDDPEDPNERYYGNPDVRGPDALHGTHVAGIIAAERENGLGMDGVASHVRIMSVRAVPQGDERDKDVANAIRYAVDNGAQIINMSFGKGQSPNKKIVDEAVRYAMKKDVLLVHSAGNEGAENNSTEHFPNDRFLKKGLFQPRYADNWIEVGASSWQVDENLAAGFSNYSNFWVDLFAPGVEIYSTAPFDQYETLQGTSMAAPVVTGVAAVIRSYFPELTARQVKQVIMDSVEKANQLVYQPGEDSKKVPFRQLSVTGGIVNAYKAFELAAGTRGKKKIEEGSGKTKGGKKAQTSEEADR